MTRLPQQPLNLRDQIVKVAVERYGDALGHVDAWGGVGLFEAGVVGDGHGRLALGGDLGLGQTASLALGGDQFRGEDVGTLGLGHGGGLYHKPAAGREPGVTLAGGSSQLPDDSFQLCFNVRDAVAGNLPHAIFAGFACRKDVSGADVGFFDLATASDEHSHGIALFGHWPITGKVGHPYHFPIRPTAALVSLLGSVDPYRDDGCSRAWPVPTEPRWPHNHVTINPNARLYCCFLDHDPFLSGLCPNVDRSSIPQLWYCVNTNISMHSGINAIHDTKTLIPCEYCGFSFDEKNLGRYGCPNCEGEDLAA